MAKLFRILLILVIVLLSIGINTNCTYFSPIVGTWRDSQGHGTIQFMRNGNVILETENFVITGKWQNVSNDVINLSLDGGTGGIFDPGGADSWQYTISGNTMTVVASGSGDVFYRVVKSTTQIVQTIRTTTKITSTTTTNIQPSIKVIYPAGGEIFHVGQSIDIKWTTTNIPKDTSLVLSLEIPNVNQRAALNGYGYNTVANTGSFTWIIPLNVYGGSSTIGNQERINVQGIVSNTGINYGNAIGSSGYFSIEK
jgi:hypothetical protein